MQYNTSVKKTKYIRIDPTEKLTLQLEEAANTIRSGGLVAFPTETVYGLGANALDGEAVKSIFIAKNRPADNPVITHLASVAEMRKYVNDVPEVALRIANALWPGPLTLVLLKNDLIPLEVTAGADTVTLRVPSHPVAQALIQQSGVPIAAPSANTSGRPSPTTAQHVLEDLDEKIDFVIDGGPTPIGVESTVLDLVAAPPVILRPGAVTFAQLQEYIIDLRDFEQPDSHSIVTQAVRSPGMKYKHYSPTSKVILVHSKSDQEFLSKIESYIKSHFIREKIGIISFAPAPSELVNCSVQHQQVFTVQEYAQILFGTFRTFETAHIQILFIQSVSAEGIGRAVLDRMTRAADEVLR